MASVKHFGALSTMPSYIDFNFSLFTGRWSIFQTLIHTSLKNARGENQKVLELSRGTLIQNPSGSSLAVCQSAVHHLKPFELGGAMKLWED